MNRKIVEVEWVDSSGRDGWQTEEAAKIRPHKIYSVGYVVEEAEEFITLVESRTSLNSDNDKVQTHGCALSIPKVAIKKTRILRKK